MISKKMNETAAETAGTCQCKRLEKGALETCEGWLAREAPLDVAIDDHRHGVLMRTPGADRELVLGYLFTEGLIASLREVAHLNIIKGWTGIADGNIARVSLKETPAAETTADFCFETPTVERFTCLVVQECVENLIRHQPLYRQTGGVHAAAIYGAGGSLQCCHEDVSRHNALDKSIGFGLDAGWFFHDKIAVFSGRASLKMVQKATRAGLSLLVCCSSPTDLAVQAAEELNLTLVKSGRDKTLTIYSHADRLI